MRREDRCALSHAVQMCDELHRTPTGLRRALGSATSYSLLDLASYGDRHGVPRAAADFSATPAVSTSSSQQSLGTAAAAGSSSLDVERTSPIGATPPVATTPEPEQSVSTASSSSRTFDVDKVSSWRGTYARSLQVDATASCVRTAHPDSGRVTNVWRFDQIVAVVEEPFDPGDAPDAPGAANAALTATTSLHPAGTSKTHSRFSLLLEGSASPLLTCFGSSVVERVRFTMAAAECSSLLAMLRSCISTRVHAPSGLQAHRLRIVVDDDVVLQRSCCCSLSSALPRALGHLPDRRILCLLHRPRPKFSHRSIGNHGSFRSTGRSRNSPYGSPGGSPLSNRTSGAMPAGIVTVASIRVARPWAIYKSASQPGSCDSPALTAASPNLNESTLSSFNSRCFLRSWRRSRPEAWNITQ